MRYARALISACSVVIAAQVGSACNGSVSVEVVSEIGPEGGTLVGPGGVQVIIPPGALAERTTLSIRAVPAAEAPALPYGQAFAGDVYAFEPHGKVFAANVTVKIPRTGEGGEVRHASCAAGSAGASACDPWDPPLSGVVYGGGFATFATDSFSLYALEAATPIGGPGGAGGMGGAGGSGGAGNAGGMGGAGGSGGCVYDGAYIIDGPAALAALGAYCEINGNLAITAQDLTSIVVPSIVNIHGDLVAGGDLMLPVQTLSFPALTHAHGVYINYYTFDLHAVSFDSLVSVDEGISVSHGDNIAVSLPALQSVGGHFTFYNDMASLSAPSLQSVGGIVELYDLATLDLPKLATIGGYLSIEKTKLASLDLPSLVSIGEIPGSTARALDLNEGADPIPCAAPLGNTLLADIHLPLLTNLGLSNDGDFNIGYNPMLPQCRIDALAAQLHQAGWTGQVLNADPAACLVSSAACP